MNGIGFAILRSFIASSFGFIICEADIAAATSTVKLVSCWAVNDGVNIVTCRLDEVRVSPKAAIINGKGSEVGGAGDWMVDDNIEALGGWAFHWKAVLCLSSSYKY